VDTGFDAMTGLHAFSMQQGTGRAITIRGPLVFQTSYGLQQLRLSNPHHGVLLPIQRVKSRCWLLERFSTCSVVLGILV
jgi:hypothetical protein